MVTRYDDDDSNKIYIFTNKFRQEMDDDDDDYTSFRKDSEKEIEK